MSAIEKRAFPLIFSITSISYVMSIVMRSDDFGRHWMVREDGLLEWGTAMVLLAGAILCGYRCWSLRRGRPKAFLLGTAACGLLLLFGVGEELSWGQRVFAIEPPAFFLQHNAQHEITVHNLVVGDIHINKLIFGKLLAVGVVLYLLLPVGYRGFLSVRQLVDRLAVPVPRLHHILAILTIALMVETSEARKRGEITEFALSSIGLLVLLNPRNALIFRNGSLATPAEVATGDAAILAFAPRESAQNDVPAAQPSRRAA